MIHLNNIEKFRFKHVFRFIIDWTWIYAIRWKPWLILLVENEKNVFLRFKNTSMKPKC